MLSPLVMSLPLAGLIAGVLVTIVVLVRAVVGPGRPWMLGLVGAAVAPVQGLAFLIAGWILFRGGPHMQPTFAQQVGTLLNDPARVVPLLLAFVAGGAAFGVCSAARPALGARVTPANPGMESRRAGS